MPATFLLSSKDAEIIPPAPSQHLFSSTITLQALRLVVSCGWLSLVTSLQLASLEVLVACREASDFRLRIARKTPRRVWQAKLCTRNGLPACSGKAWPRRSERLTLPRVTRMLYDRPTFDLGQVWALPAELVGLTFGTEFGGEIEGLAWPSSLESIIFWRRYVHAPCWRDNSTF